MENKLHAQTAKAFNDKIKAFDKDVQKLYTFEVESFLNRLDASLTRLYDNSCLSVQDFQRLDKMLLKRREKYVFA